ncbi:unnamed protein product [Protopolystoma xenopodis]|uniref:Uncharacterized protein n=1 Tax=Protopolystoma xenopodis TaxID=117903 RepID=A0A3S5ARZ1_9PLAT|nr:unnamed protein product [Protopolystoma xenopodis]
MPHTTWYLGLLHPSSIVGPMTDRIYFVLPSRFVGSSSFASNVRLCRPPRTDEHFDGLTPIRATLTATHPHPLAWVGSPKSIDASIYHAPLCSYSCHSPRPHTNSLAHTITLLCTDRQTEKQRGNLRRGARQPDEWGGAGQKDAPKDAKRQFCFLFFLHFSSNSTWRIMPFRPAGQPRSRPAGRSFGQQVGVSVRRSLRCAHALEQAEKGRRTDTERQAERRTGQKTDRTKEVKRECEKKRKSERLGSGVVSARGENPHARHTIPAGTVAVSHFHSVCPSVRLSVCPTG